jgi:hypothetical protein
MLRSVLFPPTFRTHAHTGVRSATVFLFGWALWLAVQRGYSFVGVFSQRVDSVLGVLRKWNADLTEWWQRSRRSGADLSSGV